MLKNLVMNFVRDERGAESAEVGVTNVLLAGGAIAGGKSFRDAIKDKQDQIITELGTVDVGS
ncbi:MAG: Flp family type IVb pilin [Phycisphaerales bacterium]